MLIVAAEFPPLKTIGRIRTVKFVEHLRQHGWHSVVVTLQPTGQEPIFDAKLHDEVAPEAEVIRLPLVSVPMSASRISPSTFSARMVPALRIRSQPTAAVQLPKQLCNLPRINHRQSGRDCS
ncbi:MAG: hypothetical protein IPI27_20445 [Betaproteobacteria bacterium]|nr:hypothetical protein [Betaproteobacteria bacterium]